MSAAPANFPYIDYGFKKRIQGRATGQGKSNRKVRTAVLKQWLERAVGRSQEKEPPISMEGGGEYKLKGGKDGEKEKGARVMHF